MTAQSPSAPPCVLVIFGAAGDLTQRLLMPALYNLRRAKLLPDNFAVIGVAHAPKDDGAFRKELASALGMYGDGEPSRSDVDWLSSTCSTCRATLMMLRLTEASAAFGQDRSPRNRGNYLSIWRPTQAFATIPQNLSRADFERDGRTLAPHHHRKALRDRFALGPGPQWQTPQRARREPDLPDRSLSRQRDRSEHHGPALRQRHVRAVVVPQPHRSCPDHGGRR